ncbi:hypothetical protein PHMEG_0004016 [Phytophthora megakarya]|uniref:Jacalin-type lectin domain-containing protein n=1 Tax=Phytophthora megakarya TaxID=4795 RepID=A0A225WWG8_9STRA|nr:hypothetical protein PHMEG_0004016 [Phytophthora megakarya]
MKLIYQVLTTVTLVASAVTALENGVMLGESFGEPHGKKYSDLDLVVPGQSVQSITLRTGKRVDAVVLEIREPSGKTRMLHHGGTGGNKNQTQLAPDEHIVHWEAQWGDDGDRIEYISFTTDKNNTFFGGTETGNVGQGDAPEGYQLGGFFGYCGRELDEAGPIWTSIEPVD